MADIEIKCPVCERTVTVSEFADPDSLYCHSCGEKLQKPASTPGAERKKPGVNRPVMATREPPPGQQQPAEESDSTEWRFHRHTRKRDSDSRKFRVSPAVLSWLVFAILAAIMYPLKYRNILPPEYGHKLAYFAPFIIIAFHVLVILKAFKDSVYHGTLCLLLPPYSLYYLFLICDDFYMRAAFGGLLVGLGEDTFYFLKDVLLQAYNIAYDFIHGGALR